MAEKKGKGINWINVGSQVKELAEESWDQYWAEMEAAEAMEFLEDPKQSLIDAGLIDRDYRIQTLIVNADVRSTPGPICNVLFVFHREKFATITVYRHPHD